MSARDADHVVREDGALLSGVAAAISYGEPLSAEGAEVDLYLSGSLHVQLGLVVAAVADPLGSVVVRVVSDDRWSSVLEAASDGDDGVQIAPRAAVALDLMDSGDPRQWIAAEHLVAAGG